jgi:hypothetical protein
VSRLTILLSLWWLFASTGFVLLFGSIAAALHEAGRGAHGAVLINPTAIAVSGSGEIYVYSAWREIRAFDSTGRLLRAWPVNAGQGAVRMAVDSAGTLHAASIRNGTHYQFEASGHLIAAISDSRAYDQLPPESSWRASSPTGDTYELRRSSVVRISTAGAELTVIPGPPRFLLFFFSAVPRSLLAVHGGLLLIVGVALRHLRRQRAPTVNGRADG